MEPTSHQPLGSVTGSASSKGSAHSENTSPTDAAFSTTAAHATGDNPYPADSATQPTDGSLKGKLDSAVASGKTKLDDAVASGKKWLSDTGVADQAQQLPQKAKDLGNQAWTSITGLTNTQKAIGVGVLAAAVAFLAVRGKGKKQAPEYRDRPRKSPFDHQPSTRDGDHAYDRRGQRPWGNSRYGTSSAPANKPRVTSGSGYTSSPSTHSADHGRTAASSYSSAPGAGPRRDQGPAAGNRYDANTSGSQNPNNAS